jgi:hypothetical protein
MTFNSGFSGGSKVCPLYGGGTAANPANILVMQAAPPAAVANQPGENPIGTIWINVLTGNTYQLVQNTYALGQVWTLLGGAAAAVATINSLTPTGGNIIIAGTASQITATSLGSTITLSTPAAFVAPGSIAATTTVTATLGNITATNGNFVASTAGSGIVIPAATVASGASPQTSNARAGRVVFSGVSIAANADQVFVINNTQVTAATTVVLVTMDGCITGTALSLKSVVSAANSITITVTNGNGVAIVTQNTDLTFSYMVLNT